MTSFAVLVAAAVCSNAGAHNPVPCHAGHASCPSTFGMNSSGCCALNDPDAVCCQTVLIGPTGPIVPGNEGLKRSYCCPKGSGCSERGCTPLLAPLPSYCGPTQGNDCNVSYLCSSGPNTWATGKPAVVVIGDSVSCGWTPVLTAKIAATHTTVHSPGLMSDGGARSTSNFVNCADYLLQTATLQPLPLKKGDALLINFGLHDYNQGLAGVPEYTQEYADGLNKAQAIADKNGATIFIVGSTPAHNTASPADNPTVVGLNKAAASLAASKGLAFIDLYTPIMAKCGPVPWSDNGTAACALCAPRCRALGVHYSSAGYDFISDLIWKAVSQTMRW